MRGWRKQRGKGLFCQPDPSKSVGKSPFRPGVTDLPSVREFGRFLPVPPHDLRGPGRKNT